MRYLSVCSGIEAATVAWHPLGWTPVAFSEIEPFPAAVLAHHYPDVPNYGDMTKHKEWPLEPGSIDLLVGGTPCQSFSVAGLRKGISDPRGGLMLTYLEIAQRLRPRWIVWENVPGVLSSGGGRDFGSFLGALGELGYGWAYRVIDAQYCRVDGRWPKAVPQRRRRVFVVGCDLERDPGGRERAAEVLALATGLRWHLEESGKTRKAAPADAEAGVGAGCVTSHDVAPCLETTCHDYSRADGFTMVAETLTKQNAGGAQRMPDKDNFGAVLQPVGYRWQNDRDGLVEDGTAPACRASAGSSGFHEMNHPVVLARDNAAHAAVAFANRTRDGIKVPEVMADGIVPALTNPGDGGRSDAINVAVAFKPGQSAEARSLGAHVDVACTLEAGGGGNNKQAVAFASNLGTRGGDVYDNGVSPTVRTGSGLGIPSPPAVAHALRGEGFDANEDGTGRGTPLVPTAMTVRRLTPRECERLQAFPDDYTLIPWRKKPADECPDGPRYKALGNSMAVNCMAWIGERIAAVEAREQ